MSKRKIVSFLHLPENVLMSTFKNRLDIVEIVHGGTTGEITEDEACELVKDATVLLAFPGSPYMSRKMLEAAKNVELIQMFSVGYDHIDIEAANELGIPVANNPGWNAITVAEHTIMLILMTLKQTLYASKRSLEKNFKVADIQKIIRENRELKGKTLGIIGMGNTGREVAKRAKPFGPKIVYTKRNRLSAEDEEILGIEYRTLKELLSESDIVSLHVSLTNQTRNLIGEKEIALMKDGAIIINTAREGILDEHAVASALKRGKLSAVGLDVVSWRMVGDVIHQESPLLGSDNVTYTPHLAGNTVEANIRAGKQCFENVFRFLDGEKPFYLVNNVWQSEK